MSKQHQKQMKRESEKGFKELRQKAIKLVMKWQKQSWTSNPEPAEAFIDFFNITAEELKQKITG